MPKYLGNGLGGPFSTQEPWLRIYWDATSLDSLMRDPLGYVLEMNGGWRSREPAPPLTFGDLYGRVRQFYDVKRSEGMGREEVLRNAMRYAAQLGYAHDLETIKLNAAAADVEKRSTESLARSIVWHDYKYGSIDPVKPVIGESGTALTEQLFIVPLPFTAYTGEQYHLCGYLDGVIEYMGDRMPREMKHTLNEMSEAYFKNYECSTQFRCYLLVAWLHFTGGEGFQSDILIDATKFGRMAGNKKEGLPEIPYVEFTRKVFSASRALLEEWTKNLEYWIKTVAERDQRAGLYDPAPSAWRPWSPPGQALFTKKDGTGGSAFKRMMTLDPGMREAWLRERFTQQEPWNPTVEREKF